MNSADYQLKHQALGRLPSVWRSMADKDTRNKLRNLLDLSAGGDLIQASREIADIAANGQTFFTNGSFRYIEGNYAVVGRSQLDFSHEEASIGGNTYYVGIRDGLTPKSNTASPSPLARLTADFVRDLESGAFASPPVGDFYLVPVPDGFFPFIISGRDSQLHAGVDFEPRPGYLLMHVPPSLSLDSGLVLCPLAQHKPSASVDDYVREGSNRKSNRFLAEYQRKSHSIEAFKRAMAEYAGLHVFEAPDVVLKVSERSNQTAYTMASSGVVIIDYPHNKLQTGDYVDYGQVISNGLHVDVVKEGTKTLDREIVLDGILPTNGLHFNPGKRVQLIYQGEDPVTGKEHLYPVFNGPVSSVGAVARLQKQYELSTGNFLSDHFSGNLYVDFWDLIVSYYGTTAILVRCDFHNQAVASKVHAFAQKHKPITSSVLLGIDYGSDYDLLQKDGNGAPVLDDYNNTPSFTIQETIYSLVNNAGGGETSDAVELSGVTITLGGEDVSLSELPMGVVLANGSPVTVGNSYVVVETTEIAVGQSDLVFVVEGGVPIRVGNSYVIARPAYGNIDKTEVIINGEVYLKDL